MRTLIRITYGDGLLGTIALWYDDGLNREWLAWLAQNYALDESLEWPAHLIPVYERALQFPPAPVVDEESKQTKEHRHDPHNRAFSVVLALAACMFSARAHDGRTRRSPSRPGSRRPRTPRCSLTPRYAPSPCGLSIL